MKLAVKLWLLGALLPAVGTVSALLLAGGWFRSHLEEALDRALLAQAAVESVSLFDGPGGRVHLHMASSPLVDSVRPFAPSGDLFGPDGALVMSYPPRPPGQGASADRVSERLLPGVPGGPPRLTTHVEPDGQRRRDLTVTVVAPAGGLYELRLCASLWQLDASSRAFYRTTLSLALLFALGLIVLQTLQARRLRARLQRLGDHMAALREGNFDRTLPPDAATDEIAELHDVIAEATAKLRAARAGEKRLLADAAHELRTPLTLMRTSIDLALRRERSPAELREALAETRREVDRLTSLCQSLLDLNAVGQGAWDRTLTDLRALVGEAVLAARAEAEARGLLIQLESASEAAAPVLLHESAVRQALDNLLSNALKFAPRGSTVEVVVEAPLGPGRPRCWRVSVRDHGPGVPSAHRETIFAPFRQLPVAASAAGAGGSGRPIGGTPAAGHGLGLTIAREIAERHGGRLSLDDTLTAGARFLLELPAE
jgi:signal transduction histidine kinase